MPGTDAFLTQLPPVMQTLEAHCFFYDKLPPADLAPLPQDYDTVYAKLITGG